MLPVNLGPTAPWDAMIVDTRDFYAVTDPDLDFTGIPADWPDVCIAGIRMGAMKCGFSLDETRIPSANPAWILDEFHHYPKGDHPARWSSELRSGLYIRYPIDTTFAVYPPGGNPGIGGWRLDRPYTARHLPWHVVLGANPDEASLQIVLDDEINYYFLNASGASVRGPMVEMLNSYQRMRAGESFLL
jgi:hypothetical protein